ncbi:DUF2236 domain-containing protein [Sesbania bispinosa]|nr:DUF2236 domain-containing protein [Sesbania bispinosa]
MHCFRTGAQHHQSFIVVAAQQVMATTLNTLPLPEQSQLNVSSSPKTPPPQQELALGSRIYFLGLHVFLFVGSCCDETMDTTE